MKNNKTFQMCIAVKEYYKQVYNRIIVLSLEGRFVVVDRKLEEIIIMVGRERERESNNKTKSSVCICSSRSRFLPCQIEKRNT